MAGATFQGKGGCCRTRDCGVSAKTAELAIFTGRIRQELDYTLDRWKVREFFTQIVTVEDVAKPKPSPEGLLKILGRREPEVALYIGDNVDDALAARSARMPFVGVSTAAE